MTLKIVNLITSHKQSKERSAGTVMALGRVMVIMLIKMVGRATAIDMSAMVISRAFKDMSPELLKAVEEELRKEKQQ
jgi:hypothetical protein